MDAASLQIEAVEAREAAGAHKREAASHRRATRRELRRLERIERDLGRFGVKVVVVNDPREAPTEGEQGGNRDEDGPAAA